MVADDPIQILSAAFLAPADVCVSDAHPEGAAVAAGAAIGPPFASALYLMRRPIILPKPGWWRCLTMSSHGGSGSVLSMVDSGNGVEIPYASRQKKSVRIRQQQ
jgi:hypothetical protein